MARLLLVNADDFDITPKVNDGIIESIKNGVVRNTTVMVNMLSSKEILSIRDLQDINIGIHFNLTSGKPILPIKKIPSLVDHEGVFHGYRDFTRKLFEGKINLSEV